MLTRNKNPWVCLAEAVLACAAKDAEAPIGKGPHMVSESLKWSAIKFINDGGGVFYDLYRLDLETQHGVGLGSMIENSKAIKGEKKA